MEGERAVTETVRTRAGKLLSELSQDGKGWILLVVSAGWFFSVGVRFAYPTLLPFFRDEFQITLTTAGLLVSGVWMAYAVGQFPGGVLGDRIGEGNILVISTLLSVLGIVAVTVSNTVVLLFAGTIGFGLATALYGPTRFTIFTDIYADRAGTAIGVTMAAGSIGNTVLPVCAGLVATYATWRLGFGALVPFFVAIAVAIWVVLPGRTSSPSGDQVGLSLDSIRKLLRAVSEGGIPIVVTIQTFAGFASQGFVGFYPTYLVSVKGLSPSMAAMLFGLYFAAGTVVQPAAGIGRDRFGARRMLMLLLGIYFVGLLVLQAVHGLAVLALLTVFLSGRNGVGVINNTYISTTLPDDLKGSGLGLLRTAWILIGATSPFVVGFVADSGRFEAAFLLLAAFAGVATALTTLIPDQ